MARLMTTLVTPYTRRELPGWGRLLGMAGGFSQARWRAAGNAQVRGKWHGYLMTLDLADPTDRLAYFIARYHDLPSQLFIREVLQSGETFVDIGANAGMMTLLGAGVVGPRGRVYCFEPNPQMFARLMKDVELNGLRHVTARPVGVGDAEGEFVLRVLAENGSLGTLAAVDGKGDLPITGEHRVQVKIGDDELAAAPDAPMLVKIDVEGFECHVLRGLRKTLKTRRPAVMTEALPWILERAGTTIGELFRIMHELGYRGYELGKGRKHLRYQLTLRAVPSEKALDGPDIAWIHPESAHSARVIRLLR